MLHRSRPSSRTEVLYAMASIRLPGGGPALCPKDPETFRAAALRCPVRVSLERGGHGGPATVTTANPIGLDSAVALPWIVSLGDWLPAAVAGNTTILLLPVLVTTI